jgi:hypothetical protein
MDPQDLESQKNNACDKQGQHQQNCTYYFFCETKNTPMQPDNTPWILPKKMLVREKNSKAVELEKG